MLSAKLNQVRFDGEPHNPRGPAFTAAVIDARDEFTECHEFFFVITFHGLECKSGLRDCYEVFIITVNDWVMDGLAS